ncbi:MAG: ABC transporter ATP-binding protein [Chloroflexota bacterium]|nr:ABC transporter ATP-binding protein [Chloroflexota bacterium]
MNVSPIVRLVGVSKSYGSPSDLTSVLGDVDLTIARGQKMSLIGPSGSGKSTLMGLVAGLLRPTSGTVEIDGVDMSDLDDAARAHLRASRIGIALQSDNLIPFLTARENVELATAFVPGGSRQSARARAVELLDRFGVGGRAHQRPRQLSGGEAQRVALAVAMANEPAVLLADEVVGQLDRETAGRVVHEVLAADFAVLFVTHDVGLADLADHRYAIHDGRIWAR